MLPSMHRTRAPWWRSPHRRRARRLRARSSPGFSWLDSTVTRPPPRPRHPGARRRRGLALGDAPGPARVRWARPAVSRRPLLAQAAAEPRAAGPGPGRMNLGFLASHRGSNMQALVDAARDGRLHATPRVVISNNGDAEALARAR